MHRLLGWVMVIAEASGMVSQTEGLNRHLAANQEAACSVWYLPRAPAPGPALFLDQTRRLQQRMMDTLHS